MSTPKVKHFKTKTVIELTPKQVDQYAKYLRELDSTTSMLNECGELYVSDLQNLINLEWRLRELLGLKFNRENWQYEKKEK
jgi:hypothetical protein